MTKRICKKCGKNKPLNEFASAGVVKGVTYYRHLCIPCYTVSKKPRRNALAEKFYEYKKSLSCNRCGYTDYRALQFHHTNDDKLFAVADMIRRGFSFDKIMAEANKCEVLCANCHQIEHTNYYRDIA